MEKPKRQDNVHKQHRQRMKEKALKHGFDSFHPHEILEMLLYSTNKRCDTNPVAHELIRTFGSFHKVFDASYEDLCKVNGVGEVTAFLIKSIPAAHKLYLSDKICGKRDVYIRDAVMAYRYVMPRYIDKTTEVVSGLFLNSAGKLLAFEIVSEGITNTSEISVRKVIESCIKHSATQFLLCHNHPSGVALPSGNDVRTTKVLDRALRNIGVRLIDHIVIADDDFVSMRSSSQFTHAFADSEPQELPGGRA